MHGHSDLGLIDTHAHLDMSPLAEDQSGAVNRAKKAGVCQIITIGIDLVSSGKAVDLAGQFPGPSTLADQRLSQDL